MSELTTATPADRHRFVAATFARLIEGVSDWSVPTPVPEWRAGDVVDHLTSWLPGLLGSVGIDLPQPGGDRAADFAAQTEAVQRLLDDPEARARGVSFGPMGEQPLGQVLDSFYTVDVFMHSWDLARATGQQVELDEDSAAALYAGLGSMGPALQASGQFGTPVPVADDAPPLDKLMGLIGRDPQWTAPA